MYGMILLQIHTAYTIMIRKEALDRNNIIMENILGLTENHGNSLHPIQSSPRAPV